MKPKLTVYKIEYSKYESLLDRWRESKTWWIRFRVEDEQKPISTRAYGDDEMAAFMQFKRNSDKHVGKYDIVLGVEDENATTGHTA